MLRCVNKNFDDVRFSFLYDNKDKLKLYKTKHLYMSRELKKRKKLYYFTPE